ncbi:MAG: hypothetical protein FJ405_08960 [Verrucomicrobia bacterium]|nr:hypothetical protein [Verrucomicrobiota bacterium]
MAPRERSFAKARPDWVERWTASFPGPIRSLQVQVRKRLMQGVVMVAAKESMQLRLVCLNPLEDGLPWIV